MCSCVRPADSPYEGFGLCGVAARSSYSHEPWSSTFRYGVHFVVQSSTEEYFVVQGSTGVVLFQYGVVFCST